MTTKWDYESFLNGWEKGTLNRKTTHGGFLVRFFANNHILTYKSNNRGFNEDEIISINLGENILLWNADYNNRFKDWELAAPFRVYFNPLFKNLDVTKAGLIDKIDVTYETVTTTASSTITHPIFLFSIDNEYFLCDHIAHNMTANEYRKFCMDGVCSNTFFTWKKYRWAVKLPGKANTIAEARELLIPKENKERPDEGCGFAGYWFLPEEESAVPPPMTQEFIKNLTSPPHPMQFGVPEEFWMSHLGRWQLVPMTRRTRTPQSRLRFGDDLINRFDSFWAAFDTHTTIEEQFEAQYGRELFFGNKMVKNHALRSEGKTLAEIRQSDGKVWVKGVLHNINHSRFIDNYEDDKPIRIEKRFNTWNRITSDEVRRGTYNMIENSL